MKARIFGVAAALALSGAATHVAGQYRFTDLGALVPGATDSYASGINAGGQVVGSFNLSNGGGGGFLYSNGTAQILTALGVGTGAAAGGPSAINDAGTIAGEVGISGVGCHACVYTNGTLTDLGTLGGAASWAASINDSGQAAGTSETTPGNDSPQDAFLYSNGAVTDLDPLLGGQHESGADAINDAGQVVGSEGANTFVYSNGAVTVIRPVIPSGAAVPGAINDGGQVVGGLSFSDGGHAFLWSAAAGVADLGTLPAPYNHTSTAFGINDSGQIVGNCFSSSSPTGAWTPPHAFLYSNGTMKDLNSLTSAPGFTLCNAGAINASGQIIGNAQVNGVSPPTDIAFLLTPLEPGDANGDGRVDVNNLTIVLTNFGQTGADLEPGRLQRQRHGQRQRPHDRAFQLRLRRERRHRPLLRPRAPFPRAPPRRRRPRPARLPPPPT